MGVIFLTGDLLFSSRVSEAGKQQGVEVQVRGSAEAAVATAAEVERAEVERAVVLIDLTMRGLDIGRVVSQLRAANTRLRIVAFGPHVQAGALEAARIAGCDEVMTRGQFDREIGRVVRLEA